MIKLKKIVVFLSFGVIPFIGEAQQEKIMSAYKFLQNRNLDSAKIDIDQAIEDPSTLSDFQAWHLRGVIYFFIYKEKEKSNKQSPARLTALESTKKSMDLDTAAQNLNENKKNIRSLISSLYNDASSSLDSVNYPIAITNFEKFKQYYSLVDSSNAKLKQKDIEFQLAMATVYTEIYKSRKENNGKFFNLTKTTLNSVLDLDPNNITANYNMGLLYYNKAVDLINDSDYDIDIVTFEKILDDNVTLFKQSLPFMEKAYELDPKRKETLMGLSGIYYGLHDIEKSNSYKEKSENIEKEK